MSTTSLGLGSSGSGVNPNYQLDIGNVLGRTFTVWIANFVPFTLLTTGMLLPSIACAVAMFFLPATSNEFIAARLASQFLAAVTTLVVTGAVTYGVFQELRGQRATIGETLSVGISRFLPILVVGILYGLAVTLGLCALCIPGFILLCMYYVATPATVVEEAGPFAAFGRSAELTDGNRWSILAIILVLGVLVGGLSFVVAFAAAALSGGLSAVSVENAQAAVQLGTTLLKAPFAALQAIPPVIVYYDLRIGKEGADVEELVKVFE